MAARDALSSTHRHPLFARINPYISRGAEQGGAAVLRRAPLAGHQGRVIEVGAGHGLDFAHYPAGVTQVVAAKPEPHLRALAQAAAKHAPLSIEVKTDAAEALSAEDGEFGVAVASDVLCSVSDQAVALREIARVRRALDATIYTSLAGELPLRTRHTCGDPGGRFPDRPRRTDRVQTESGHAIDPAHPRHRTTSLSSIVPDRTNRVRHA